MRYFSALLFCCFLVFSCESDDETQNSAEEIELSESTLVFTDSIGIEMGDSLFVFGAIADVDILPDGNIIVLDGTYCNLRIFSPDGEHVSTISGRGDAPGELSHPFDMINWRDGTVSVIDPFKQGIHRYSLNDGEWLGLELSIYGNIHTDPVVVSDSEFVCFKSRFDVDGDAMIATAMISRFPVSTEPLVTYWERTVPWDPANLGNITLELFFSNSFAADPSTGRVYVSAFNEDNYIIDCFNADGSVMGSISREYVPVPKSPEEIQQEKDFIAFTLSSGDEGNPNFNYNCEPWPNHLPITGLYVNSDGKLWTRRGGTDIPTFDVWNANLELVGSATIPELEGDGSNYQMVFGDDFIVMWNENPEDYQKVYILEVN